MVSCCSFWTSNLVRFLYNTQLQPESQDCGAVHQVFLAPEAFGNSLSDMNTICIVPTVLIKPFLLESALLLPSCCLPKKPMPVSATIWESILQNPCLWFYVQMFRRSPPRISGYSGLAALFFPCWSLFFFFKHIKRSFKQFQR